MGFDKHILTRCGKYLDDWINEEYTLMQTCGASAVRKNQTNLACPEQYDMLDSEGNTVGYFRLRHGSFTVEYPDVGGKLVLHANPQGDGCFEQDEREYWLTLGFLSVIREMTKQGNAIRIQRI